MDMSAVLVLVLSHLLAAAGGFLFAWFGINVASRLVVPLMTLEQTPPTYQRPKRMRQEQIFEEMWGPILPRTFRAVTPQDQRSVLRREGGDDD